MIITMAKKEIKLFECKCERCEHKWITRNQEIPIVCPKCKNPYWDKPKTKFTKNDKKKK